MYRLSRLMLLLAVALYGYCLLLVVILAALWIGPWAIPPLLFLLSAAFTFKKGRRWLTAFGTAAWASPAELERAGMFHAKTGLILGRILDTRPGRPIRALLNRRLSAEAACRDFLGAASRRGRKQGRLVRLPQACHVLVTAPTSVGKGVSLILPWLLSVDESCVVVDLKGENALLTAEHRRRMGHEIVILDPFGVVT